MTTHAMYPITNKVDGSYPSLGFKASVPANDLMDLVPHLRQLNLERSDQALERFLKSLLSQNTPDDVVVNWLKQLKDNIFTLDRNIAQAVLDLQWTSRGHEVVMCYHNLILNMVSAHPSYIRPVLLMIIKGFSAVGGTEDSLNSESFKRAHALLQDIFLLVPASPTLMSQMLAEKFPYLKHQRHLVLSYSLNVLNVCSYLPAFRLFILENLLDKYLQVDLQCSRDVISEFEDEMEQVYSMGMDISACDSVVVLADMLDLLMDGLFKFIECSSFCTGDTKLDWEATKKLYRELLTLFDKLILPSSRCTHLPFVMFYVCSLHPSLCEGFLEYLWKKVNDPLIAPLRRQFAAFYIGSFLARASYVNISNMIACYDLMRNWVHSYINNYDGLNSCEIGSHGTFYSVCQALFYVFAFRHKEFINMKNGFKYLRSLNFERIVTCRLNPLKFCQPVIVQNFASFARNYQIAYCYPIIERNTRNLFASSANICAPLITFFPFDPYLLKKSKRWIEPIYRLYDSQNDDDSMERDDDVSFVEDCDIQTISDDLFSYSRSPGFKELNYMLPQR